MTAFKNITGQTFGRLTARKYLGKRLYECVCSCGSVIQVRADHLVRSETVSCGCVRIPRENLTHRIFGEWTVLEFVGNASFGAPLWRCQCTCGTEPVQPISNLTSG